MAHAILEWYWSRSPAEFCALSWLATLLCVICLFTMARRNDKTDKEVQRVHIHTHIHYMDDDSDEDTIVPSYHTDKQTPSDL